MNESSAATEWECTICGADRPERSERCPACGTMVARSKRRRLSPLKRKLVAALRMLRDEREARGATHMVIDRRIEELVRGR